jgi:hypothetical protein
MQIIEKIALLLCLATTSVVQGQGKNDTRLVNPPECGLTYEQIKANTRRFLSSKLIANQKNYGWIVLRKNANGGVRTASLVNSQWVLTSALNLT